MNENAELRIRWEWESGRLARTPEHRATWARIEISIGHDCLTLVEDRDSGSSRRSIFAPLYPLAEWVVYNWWFLLYHSRPARPGPARIPLSRRDRHRHCVRSAGDGFLWPNLEVVPVGRETRLRWGRDRVLDEFSPIRYLTEGEAVLPTDDVERTLTHLVTSVLDRLVEQKETGTPLEKEWEALNELGPDERDYCIAAAKLGLDPFAQADQYEASIIEATQRLPYEVLSDFFHAVDPRQILQAVDWIADATSEASGFAGDPSEEIRSVRTALASSSALDNDTPWRLGWRQAQVARQALGLGDDDHLDIEQYVPKRSRVGVDPRLQAVGYAPGDSVRPTIVLGGVAGPSRTRFIQGRALWHRLAKDESTFLITTSYTDLQKVERAFAAELLAPAEGIRMKLSVPPSEAVQEDLGFVAEHFGVSPILIENQIENQILSGRH